MPVAAQSPALTTPATSFDRVKYFPIEFYCTGMLPNTTYDAYANGVLINPFCKPFGGTLGSPLRSDQTGRLIIQYHMAVPYNQSYLVQPTLANTNLIDGSIIINLVDPFGGSSVSSIKVLYKSSV